MSHLLATATSARQVHVIIEHFQLVTDIVSEATARGVGGLPT